MTGKQTDSTNSKRPDSGPWTDKDIDQRLQEITDGVDREAATQDYLLSMQGIDPRWVAHKQAQEEIERLRWLKKMGPTLPSDEALINFYEAEGVNLSEAQPPIMPTELGKIECSWKELSKRPEYQEYQKQAGRFHYAKEKVAWVLAKTPANWQDQERAALVKIDPKTFSRSKPKAKVK